MAIFSNIRKSRQQAKEHNAKLAEQKKKEEEQIPYRHVPTHAATDAFASAPPSWREATDRPKIIEQNRRRSAMAATGQPMSFPGLGFPRVASSLSYVSYPGQASPKAHIPRTYSHAGASSYPDGSRDVIYPIPDVTCSEPECLEGNSSPECNSDSASSQENLEMRSAKVSSGRPGSANRTTHRLHPGAHSGRTSDTSLDKSLWSGSANNRSGRSTSSRDSRPPPSTRGFNAIPQPVVYDPLQIGTAPGPLPPAAIAPPISDARKSSTNSSCSLPSLAPASTKQPFPFPPSSSSPLAIPSSVPHADPPTISESTIDFAAPTPRTTINRPVPRITRFTELEAGAPVEDKPSQRPQPAFHAEIVNFLPEPAAVVPEPTQTSAKGKRLTKRGGKLLKKNGRSAVQASAT